MHARFIAIALTVAAYLGACTKEAVDSDDDAQSGGNTNASSSGGANASTLNTGAKGGSVTSSVAEGGADAVGTVDCFTPPQVGWNCPRVGVCISDTSCNCTCDSQGKCSVACPELSARGGSTGVGSGTLSRGGAATAQGGNLQRGGATANASSTRGGSTLFQIGGAASVVRGGNASSGGSRAVLTGGNPATGGRGSAAGSTGGVVNGAGAVGKSGGVGNIAGAPTGNGGRSPSGGESPIGDNGGAPSIINCPANPTRDDPCTGGDGECPDAAGCFCIDGAITGRNCG